MGQVIVPGAKGITVNPTDRETGPGAGPGQSGNRVIMLGANAGQNSTATDLIAIGNNALSAGVTDANANGTTVIGSQAGAAMTGFTTADPGGAVVIGGFAAQNATTIPGSVVIGVQALQTVDNTGGGTTRANVIIGTQACQLGTDAGGTGVDSSVVIGYQACKGTGVGKQSVIGSVIIGMQANFQYALGSGGSISSSVLIGQGVAAGVVNITSCTVVGAGSGNSLTATASGVTMVGQGCNAALATDVVLVGRAIGITGTRTGTIIIGATAGVASNTAWGNRNIIFGFGAGQGSVTLNDDALLMETWDGASRRSFVFGDMNAGNFVFGPSTNAQRDLATINGTNQIKLINGTRGAGNPNAGGFFYVSAGALHWVGSSGTDTPLAPA